MRHIAVIDPGTRVPELDCFNRMSRAAPLPLTYHLPAQHGLDSLHRADAGIAGVVVLGSGASANDASPWVLDLGAWLRPRIEAGTPVLGLCFGHQLVAKLLGGKVAVLREDGAKHKGLRDVSIDANRLWGEASRGTLLVSHSEGVVALPEEVDVVGRSPEVAVEAFAHRTLPVWGFQAHPEATTAFASNNDVPFDADPSVLAYGHGFVDAFTAWVADKPTP